MKKGLWHAEKYHSDALGHCGNIVCGNIGWLRKNLQARFEMNRSMWKLSATEVGGAVHVAEEGRNAAVHLASPNADNVLFSLSDIC